MAFYLLIGGSIGLIGWAVFSFRTIRHQQVNAIASIVTVIGVLGTFIGIAWGLLHFDTDNIEASVPKLLEGLRVAFITSILGIAGSIALKWSTLNKQKKQSRSGQVPGGKTVDDLADLLEDILAVEKEEGKETRESLRSIEKSLTGEGESTVVTQLQKLRTTFSDKQDDLVKAFEKFADEMAKKNTEAFIAALENAIKDFNTKITEQFGENFKQLNEAVGRLNDWQEQYRQQMDKLAEEFRIAAESVERSRQSLEVIADRSNVIISSAEKLEPVLQAIQTQIDRANTSLEAFSKLADNAKEAFPVIENRLDELTDRFSVVVQDAIDNSHASMQTQRDALAEQSQQLETTMKNTGSLIQQQTVAVFEKTSEQVQQTIDKTDGFVRDNANRMTEQIRLLDQALEKVLTDSLRLLGSHLTSLSGKFVADYTPLTNHLREVVEIARNLPISERFNQPQQR